MCIKNNTKIENIKDIKNLLVARCAKLDLIKKIGTRPNSYIT
jgi:hypothetical protein